MAKDKSKLRVPFNCMVKPGSLVLIKELAEHLDRSQGETIDRAVQALAVAESFGGNHLNLRQAATVETRTSGLTPGGSCRRPPLKDLRTLRKAGK